MSSAQKDRNCENDIYYAASLMEFTARETHNKVSDVAKAVGLAGIKWAYEYAEVNHCLSFEQVSGELIEQYHLKTAK